MKARLRAEHDAEVGRLQRIIAELRAALSEREQLLDAARRELATAVQRSAADAEARGRALRDAEQRLKQHQVKPVAWHQCTSHNGSLASYSKQ